VLDAMNSTIRLICFDLGGVVIRICRSWAEGCAAAGIGVRDQASWDASRPAREAAAEDYQTGRIDGMTFAARMSGAVDGLYSPAEILAVHRSWMLGQYEGIGALIEKLHGRGLQTAALSNTNHEHWCRMAEFPAVTRLRHLLASHLLGVAKPAPMIYRALERQTGYRGAQILFFDDSLPNVQAARDLGWHAELIDPLSDTAAQIETVLAVRLRGE
jgi:FMN phosphatase YigB (HAD superfamily)